jgi:hypothetical protein
MSDKDVPEMSLLFTLSEVHALHKTVGIAIDNLNTKISKLHPGKHYDQVAGDLRSLVGVQQEILSVLDGATWIGRDVCLSNKYIIESNLGAHRCGEVIAVDDDGVTLWHIGEATVIQWGDFDTVEVFTK